jgi:UDP-glucose 4-epimerase
MEDLAESEIAERIRGRRVVVTGGTGSFGNHIIRRLLTYDPGSIVVFSRDEKKQHDMHQALRAIGTVEFTLGDVRDYSRVLDVLRGADVVFHAAALKQVPHCEYSPFEAVMTNVVGAENIRRAALVCGVETVIGVSTDKAVKPVNVMGMTKALQERILLNALPTSGTRFVCVRYGNVLGSRGSIVPVFRDMILRQEPITITHPEMTRFQLSLSEAVELVFWALARAKSGEVWVRKMPAARVIDVATAVARRCAKREDYPTTIVGLRPGEKMNEVLVSEEEMWRAREYDAYFAIPSWSGRDGNPGPTEGPTEYSSANAPMLTPADIERSLSLDGWFTEAM